MAKRSVGNERLRRAREERHWTQAEVAQAIGTSSFTVSRWELGVQAPQPHFRDKLCTLFVLSPQQLGLLPEPVEPEVQPALEPGEARARRDLTAQVRRYWIDTELEHATGRAPTIDLALTDCPAEVDDPRRVLVHAQAPRRHLPPGTTIEAAFDRAGEQLLVLGDPGAGKTTLLLELTRCLLEGASPDGPMPVVFHLASWAEARQPLGDWLVDELHRRYGVATRLGRAWIDGEQVVPLLDGLDEVADAHRDACVAAVNQFHAGHGQLPIVVCCRTAQYEALGSRLRLRSAIAIRPLTRAQVERYLEESGAAVADVRALVAEDERLRDLLSTPLFLRIIAGTYGGERGTSPPLRGSLQERRRRVLADYVEETLARPRAAGSTAEFSAGETVRWLTWLAAAMRDHSEGVFHLDWMQPSWLRARPQRLLVTLVPAALVVLTGGLVGALGLLLASALLGAHRYRLDVGAGIRLDLPGQLGESVLTGAVIGVLAGLLAAAFTYEPRIAPTNRLGWSWATFQRNLPTVLAAVLGAVVLSLLVDRVLSGVAAHLVYGLLLVVIFTAVTRPALRRRLPSRWRLVGVLLVLAAALAAGVASALVSGAPPLTVAYRVVARLAVGLSLGLLFGPQTPLCETVPAPGQGIDMSRRHGVNAGLLSASVAALVFGVVTGTEVGHMAGPAVGLVAGLLDGVGIAVIVGAGVGLRRGLGAWLRHTLLHGLLVRAGAAPVDFVGFLDHAARRILLRRRGGGYEFTHRLLLDHFAGLGAAGGGGSDPPGDATQQLSDPPAQLGRHHLELAPPGDGPHLATGGHH